jgi:hypothetical protein
MWEEILVKIRFFKLFLLRRVWRYQRVIRIRKSKMDRQHNGHKKKDKRNKQRSTKTLHKTKDQVTRTTHLIWVLEKSIEFRILQMKGLYKHLQKNILQFKILTSEKFWKQELQYRNWVESNVYRVWN